MAFKNPSMEKIFRLIRDSHTLAVVGLSPKPDRPSHGVAKALKDFGFRIVPIRPGTDSVLGETAYPSLDDVPPDVLADIDIVQVFRRPEHVDSIVDSAIALGLPAIWLQDGVVNEEAALRAKEAGMKVVMDRCLYRDRLALAQQAGWAP